jgi:magnesium transporter
VIVDCAAYQDGKRVTGLLDPVDAPSWLHRPGTFVWLGLRMPSPTELGEVFEHLGIDELDVDEVLAPHERPVLAREEDLTTLVLRTARYNDRQEKVTLGEISVLMGPDFVITVRHGQASPLSDLRSGLERDPDLLRLGPPAVVARIINQVIDDYLPALDGFERDVLEVESSVFDESRSQPVERIYRLQRQVRELLVAVDALDEPLARLIRTNRHWDEEVRADLHEAVEQLARTVGRTRSLADLLKSALDAAMTQVSLRQNEDMRKISAWVAIAAVPTAVAGVYGMNFPNLPGLRTEWGWVFVVVLTTGLCLFLHRNFRRSGWL